MDLIYALGLRCYTNMALADFSFTTGMISHCDVKSVNNISRAIESNWDFLINKDNLFFRDGYFGIRTLHKDLDEDNHKGYLTATLPHYDMREQENIDKFSRRLERWNKIKDLGWRVCFVIFSFEELDPDEDHSVVENSLKSTGWKDPCVLYFRFSNGKEDLICNDTRFDVSVPHEKAVNIAHDAQDIYHPIVWEAMKPYVKGIKSMKEVWEDLKI